jgi:hypothetical protein
MFEYIKHPLGRIELRYSSLRTKTNIHSTHLSHVRMLFWCARSRLNRFASWLILILTDMCSNWLSVITIIPLAMWCLSTFEPHSEPPANHDQHTHLTEQQNGLCFHVFSYQPCRSCLVSRLPHQFLDDHSAREEDQDSVWIRRYEVARRSYEGAWDQPTPCLCWSECSVLELESPEVCQEEEDGVTGFWWLSIPS